MFTQPEKDIALGECQYENVTNTTSRTNGTAGYQGMIVVGGPATLTAMTDMADASISSLVGVSIEPGTYVLRFKSIQRASGGNILLFKARIQ